jgi:2-polyprenyl-3-methyl-5-hydroxy-6-metoxy-1,4-benzoquinol methylase
MPFRLRLLAPEYGRREINCLDVGCGNHSPSITKRWFPRWSYYGLDRDEQGLDERDRAALSGYYRLDLERDPLTDLPREFFDVVVMAHVIEHLPDGLEVAGRLVETLRPGGRIYIEFPSVRSLALPSMPGTLHFCDDPTHVRVYDVREVANALLAAGDFWDVTGFAEYVYAEKPHREAP